MRLVHSLKKSVIAKLIFHLLKQSPSKKSAKEIVSSCLLSNNEMLRKAFTFLLIRHLPIEFISRRPSF
jgi:hypothetical protein